VRNACALICAAAFLVSCSVFDTPIRVTDPITGKMTEVPLGNLVADNAAPVTDLIGSFVGSFNPALGLMAGGALGLLFAGVRRKKKPTV